MSRAKVYVGNLPADVRRRELEDLFAKYGRILDVSIKGGARPATSSYAFVTFEDPRDADEAVRGRDGREFAGRRLRYACSFGQRLHMCVCAHT